MQADQLGVQPKESHSHSVYRCRHCKMGHMVPSVLEDEPEYTDLYVCNNCQHQTNITSVSILSSQIMTSVLGFLICLYLLIKHLGHCVTTIKEPQSGSLLVEGALVGLSFLFLLGFLYVLFRAYRSYQHRRSYLDS